MRKSEMGKMIYFPTRTNLLTDDVMALRYKSDQEIYEDWLQSKFNFNKKSHVLAAYAIAICAYAVSWVDGLQTPGLWSALKINIDRARGVC